MSLPPFVYSLSFWRSLSVLAAILAVQLGWADVVESGKILVAVLAVLELFNIVPELRAKGLVD